MTKWEYTQRTITLSPERVRHKGYFRKFDTAKKAHSTSIDELQALGEEGWELVSVLPSASLGSETAAESALAIFKRPVVTDPDAGERDDRGYGPILLTGSG